MDKMENVSSLVEEYRVLLQGETVGSVESLEDALTREGDWSALAVSHLVCLSKQYGSFMLRNALAISMAMGIEDGELGF